MKAILILDTDEIRPDCAGCMAHNITTWGEEHPHRCNAVQRRLPDNCEEKKPEWCPLKEMPELKDIPFDDGWYQRGWNDCIYTITGRDNLEKNSLIGTWPGISIGSHVWRVIFGYYPDIDDQIKEYIVSGISVYENETIGDNMILLRDIDDDSDISFDLDSWNISIFDTFEKAEKCLKSEEKRRKYE